MDSPVKQWLRHWADSNPGISEAVNDEVPADVRYRWTRTVFAAFRKRFHRSMSAGELDFLASVVLGEALR